MHELRTYRGPQRVAHTLWTWLKYRQCRLHDPRVSDFLTATWAQMMIKAMAKEKKQTWDEMTKLYPDQWLEIVEFETDKYGGVACGVIVAHGESISDFPPPPADRGTIALRYTGESTYRI